MPWQSVFFGFCPPPPWLGIFSGRRREPFSRSLTFTCTRVCTVPWHSVRVPCRAVPRRPFLGVLNLHVYPCVRFPGIRCVWFLVEGGTSGCGSQEHGVNTAHQSWIPCPGSHRDPFGHDIRKVVATQRCLRVLSNLLLPPSKNVSTQRRCARVSPRSRSDRGREHFPRGPWLSRVPTCVRCPGIWCGYRAAPHRAAPIFPRGP